MNAAIFYYKGRGLRFAGHVCPAVGDKCLLSGDRARWIAVEHMIAFNGIPDEIVSLGDVQFPWMKPLTGSNCVGTSRAFARFCGSTPPPWACTPYLFARWVKGLGHDKR